MRCLASGVFTGRLGEGRGIWGVVEGLHGRPREREQRDRGRTLVVHFVVYGHWTGRESPRQSRGWPSRCGRRRRKLELGCNSISVAREVSAAARLQERSSACHMPCFL